MAEPFADVEDVDAVWDEALTDTQWTRVDAWLTEASAKMRNDTRGVLVDGLTLDERVAADDNFAVVVMGVCRAMVLRLLKNPRSRLDVKIDDSEVRNDSTISTGELYLSDSEYRDLTGGRQRASAASSGQAFSITLGPGPTFARSRYSAWH